MTDFIKGMFVKEKTFNNGGKILKLAINMNDFYENNPTNDRGYLNIDIKWSKDGKPYAVLNDYKPQQNNSEAEEEIVKFDDEIPF